MCPTLTSSIWTNLPVVCHFFDKIFFYVCLVVQKKLKREILVRGALFTGISRPLIFHGFLAVTDQKMSQSGSKFKKCGLTLNFNRLLVQKFGIPTYKAGQILKLVKSWVNTDMCAWQCMRFFELPIIDDLQKEIFVRSALFTGISRLYHVPWFLGCHRSKNDPIWVQNQEM